MLASAQWQNKEKHKVTGKVATVESIEQELSVR
jgi:hypothetical protein